MLAVLEHKDSDPALSLLGAKWLDIPRVRVLKEKLTMYPTSTRSLAFMVGYGTDSVAEALALAGAIS